MVSGGFWGQDEEPDESAPALDQEEWEGPVVTDPEALTRAEQAVRGEAQVPAGAPDPDAEWTQIARGSIGTTLGVGGLYDVELALTSEGVAVGWDPFDPREAVGGIYPLFERGYRLLVRKPDLPRALRLLEGARVEGVEVVGRDASQSGPQPVPAPAGPPEWRQDESHAGPSASSEPPASVLSDNTLLESSARGAPSGLGATVVALVLAGAAIAIILFALRG